MKIKSNYSHPSIIKEYNQIGQMESSRELKELGDVTLDLSSQSNGAYFIVQLDINENPINKERIILDK